MNATKISAWVPRPMLDAALKIGASLNMGRSDVIRDALRLWIRHHMGQR